MPEWSTLGKPRKWIFESLQAYQKSKELYFHEFYNPLVYASITIIALHEYNAIIYSYIDGACVRFIFQGTI